MFKIHRKNAYLLGLGLLAACLLLGAPKGLKQQNRDCNNDLSLVGVILGADRQAIVEIKSTSEQLVVYEGESSSQLGTVEKIGNKSVRLTRGNFGPCELFFNSGGRASGLHAKNTKNRVVSLGRDDEVGIARASYLEMVNDLSKIWGSSACNPIMSYGVTAGQKCTEVDPASLIGKIGVLPGDIIESINSRRIRQTSDAIQAAAHAYAGRSTVEIERGGQKISIAINLF